MSEQIREQVSAFLDGELPSSETELLLKRLTRDHELRDHFGRYALIGEAVRGFSRGALTKGFSARVNHAIDGEAAPAVVQLPRLHAPRWWRPVAGAAVVAGVAAVAVAGFQYRSTAPGVQSGSAAMLAGAVIRPAAVGQPTAIVQPAVAAGGYAAPVLTANSKEALSYTVPSTSDEPAAVLPAGRLTNYVFAHSKYSSGLGQRGVLADLLIDDDDAAAAPAAHATAPAAPPAP